ncbi:hypothetical protein SNE40_022131 [Patella caerulea]|uniref:C2H2-type domain-containing protein n=1 Tax=Patella caerulea TaxID=87958 RepID=A0AAN8IXK1_PATCE
MVICNPKEVVMGAVKIIKKESALICKGESQSMLHKKDFKDVFKFSWEHLYREILKFCPGLLSILTAATSETPPNLSNKGLRHILVASAVLLHGRNQLMSLIHYIIGLIMSHGGCTLKTIERLCNIGLSVHPSSINKKLSDWENFLDSEISILKQSWENGSDIKYQLVGDNWDKNILPSYRTSQQQTVSLHLFNLIAVVDRVIPQPDSFVTKAIKTAEEIELTQYIPSVEEQNQLMTEFTFLYATSIIENHPQLNKHFKNVYPVHLDHSCSQYAGTKTCQYPLGLYDCNENKTQEVIRLMKELTNKYVPTKDGEIIEPIFFGGDRLTDERIQCAQTAMSNASSAKERLEGFISKIEDFHRLMNFLEAIFKLTYCTKSSYEQGTVYYYRNILNLRNVKGNVKNSYRAYKMLYYTILDALFMVFFLLHFGLDKIEDELPLPVGFETFTQPAKIRWLNNTCSSILKERFFDSSSDLFSKLREGLGNSDHPENYWISNNKDGRLQCHFCNKTYAYVGSLKSHEKDIHSVHIDVPKGRSTQKSVKTMEDHLYMLFKLVLLHKNLDSAVDMGDGERCVRSAKYELPVYNLTNKTKYMIGSIHLTSLTSGMLPSDQEKRLINNRFINLQGGKNNNMALDEYVEMVNRDSKVACSGHQTKESILSHSKEYPHLINISKHFDSVSEVRKRKGFHHLPSYKEDVNKVTKDLLQMKIFSENVSRELKSKSIAADRNLFDKCLPRLSTMIYRHRPSGPFHRLRNQ